jgi:Replication-relaxation
MNCRVTDREMELLEAVYERKLVGRNHLEIILPSYRYLNERSRVVLLNRSINKLFHSMCLDKAHEKQELKKGNLPCTVAIDKGGSILLGVPHKKRILHEQVNINGDKYIFRKLPANYLHIKGVNQTEVDTILFCEETESSITKWQLEKPLDFTYNGENVVIIPDVFLEMEMKGSSLFAYLEYDTGKEDHRNKTNFPTINDKLRKYRKYKSSKLWEDYSMYFPMIFFVTEDTNRIGYFKEKCKEYGLKGYAIYYKNFTKFLKHLYDSV